MLLRYYSFTITKPKPYHPETTGWLASWSDLGGSFRQIDRKRFISLTDGCILYTILPTMSMFLAPMFVRLFNSSATELPTPTGSQPASQSVNQSGRRPLTNHDLPTIQSLCSVGRVWSVCRHIILLLLLFLLLLLLQTPTFPIQHLSFVSTNQYGLASLIPAATVTASTTYSLSFNSHNPMCIALEFNYATLQLVQFHIMYRDRQTLR